MRRFDVVTLIEAGDPGLADGVLRTLEAAADEVVARPLRGLSPPGVTVTGPSELSVTDRARRYGAAGARKVLGPRAPAVRAKLAGWKRSVTGALHKV
jgi:hypothetical protein